MTVFAELLATVFLESNAGFLSLLFSAFYLIGLCGIFIKCGVDGRWALVPVARYRKLGECAAREPEGRLLAFLEVLRILITVAGLVISSPTLQLLQDIAIIIIGLIIIIYTVRTFLGLIEVFGQRKLWILLWIVIPGFPAMLWGYAKRFRPQWTVQQSRSEAAGFFSGTKADVLDQGLTVNLEERTATEMFQKKYLLRDIHLVIEPGHMVLLLGGSGAGKTTFINAVNGYEKARAEVMLNGRNLYSNYKELQYDIGFVPQADLMRGSDSVLRTLLDAAALRLPVSIGKAERRARVDEVMAIFGLTPVQNSLVSKLSGGQRKRLSIAMEFISNPTLFILDEPDSGLDGVMARELFQQLRTIADQGKIIIVITHTPDRVIDLFDDVIVLAKDANRTGRLAFFGSIGDARRYFGRERMEEIVKCVNRQEEGGEGRADEFILRYAEEVQHG